MVKGHVNSYGYIAVGVFQLGFQFELQGTGSIQDANLFAIFKIFPGPLASSMLKA